MTMVGWDISWKYATFDAEQADEIRRIGTALAEFVVDIQPPLTEFSMTENALAGFDLPDPITMAAAIDPSVAQYKDYRVDVTTGDGLGARDNGGGCAWRQLREAPQMRVATSADRSAFVDMLKRSVS